MAVQAVNHFNVSVRDMDQALVFWEQGLGLQRSGRGRVQFPHLDVITGLPGTDIEWAELPLPGGALIELFRYHRPEGRPVDPQVINAGTTHLCLEVTDIDSHHQRLAAAGFEPFSAPVTIPFGDWAGWRCLYVREPNGVVVELVERP
jgi:catechol 2,3-dioxygenase-like lactoylglutathione lyase family enzyme